MAELDRKVAEEWRRLQEAREAVCCSPKVEENHEKTIVNLSMTEGDMYVRDLYLNHVYFRFTLYPACNGVSKTFFLKGNKSLYLLSNSRLKNNVGNIRYSYIPNIHAVT